MGIYNTSNLYIVKLGIVTKIEKEGIHTTGATYYKILPKKYIAQLIKTDYREKIFKLISSGLTLSNNSQSTQNSGDMFVCKSEHFNLATDNSKHYLSKSTLIDFENQILNKQPNESKTK